jgi:hypothetical protein
MRSMANARIARFHIPFASVCLCFVLGAENANADPEDDSWRFALGGGVVSTPKFPGSKNFKTEAVPIIGVTYGRFFVGGVPGSGTPAGVGINLYQDSHWRFGAAISADVVSPGRNPMTRICKVLETSIGPLVPESSRAIPTIGSRSAPTWGRTFSTKGRAPLLAWRWKQATTRLTG